jgi:hypothetical protein
MRRTVAILLIGLSACSPAPSPSAEPSLALATITATATATPLPTGPSPSPFTFSFDVENHSSVGVVVAVASDYTGLMPGFEPGQRGTISIPFEDPQTGIGIEIQDGICGLLAKGFYSTLMPFTLVVTDGAQPGAVQLSTRAGAAASPLPLPSNALRGCLG